MLSKCFTQTKLTYRPKINNEQDFIFLFEGAENISFEPKLSQFFKRVEKYCPYLNYLQLKIESRNSFGVPNLFSFKKLNNPRFFEAFNAKVLDFVKLNIFL